MIGACGATSVRPWIGSTTSCFGARSLVLDALSSPDESEYEGDGGEMGESVTLGMFFSISPQRERHVSDACVGAVGAICCQCGGASVEFVHSGMSSMIPPKPRGSGCLVLLVHHLVALRPKHSNLRTVTLVVGSLKLKVESFIKRSRDKLRSVYAKRQVERDSELSMALKVPKRGNGDHDQKMC